MAHYFCIVYLILCLFSTLCLGLEEASFYGGSYISIPLKEAKGSTDIHFKFRTHLSNALLFLVAGTTDYCIIRLDNGRFKLNINLGAGESELLSPSNVMLSDFKWHDVFIIRKEANLSVLIDGIHTVKKHLPGKFFELNIHYGLFIGGRGNFSDIFFGHLENFRGCLAEVMYNGMLVLEQARQRQSHATVHGVTWNCAAEFDASVDRPISFVEDGAFMAMSHPSMVNFKWQLELKTLMEHSVIFYSSAPLSKVDLLALEIWKGTLKFILKQGDRSMELINDQFISDGHWHKIVVRLTAAYAELNVDSSSKGLKIPRLSGHFSNTDTLYIGGIELNKRARAMSKGLKTTDSSFKGCLRHLTIGDRQIGLPHAHNTEGLLPGCVWQYACLRKPCTDGGLCIQQGLDSFRCQCEEESCVSPNSTEVYKVLSKASLATDLELLAVKHLDVLEGHSVLIASSNLHVILDYLKFGIRDSGITFHIVEAPSHGNIVIDLWPHKNNYFTLSDVSRDKVHYVHDGSESDKDQLVIEVEFSSSESYILPAYLQGKFKFSLNVNITPVNDPPKLDLPSTAVLRLAQGTKKVVSKIVLQITDPDTLPKQLVYNVISAGSGHFEYIEKPGVPISSFTQHEVNNGQISFTHHASDSKESHISLQASDGIETSAVAKLRVSTFPQFWRLQNNTGLVLMHQTSSIITPYNLSFVSNVANASGYDAQFHIVQSPHFGIIEVEKGVDLWESSVIFTSDDLKQHRVRYRHVTSNPDYDEFQFRTTLNSSMLYTFRMTFTKCKLVKIHSNAVVLNGSWEGIISEVYLHYQTKPMLLPTTSVVYYIMRAPQYGFLLSAISKYRMRIGDSFTQEDLFSKNIKYRLHRKSYSYVYDNFFYGVIAPGCKNITGNLSVVHYPSNETRSKVQVVLERLQVEEGAKVNIGTTHLNIRTDLVSDLFFNITQTPSHGFLQVDKNSTVRNDTDYFTLNELHSNQLYYVHDDSETHHDSFKFMALSKEEENFQYVEMFHVDVLLKNDNSPVRTSEKVFYIVVGGQRLLTGDDLRYSDADSDTRKSDILYTCRELPNGEVYSAKDPSVKITEFTQEDLDNNAVLFKHKGPEYGKIKLWVTDGQFYVNGILEVQASAPFIRTFSNKKLIVQSGKEAIITNEHLTFTTNLFAVNDDVIYKVITKPSFGKTISTGNNKELLEFTQAQINEGLVRYTHEVVSASADEVGFRVRCRDAINVGQLSVRMLPTSYWEPLKVKTCRMLMVEESTSALINKATLEVVQHEVPAVAIVFYISELPRNGYLSILSTTKTAEDQLSNVQSFTQAMINEKRLLYIQSGANETNDSIVFNVTNGIVWMHSLTLDINIIPERLYLGSNNITVNEGGTVVITQGYLYILTEYYKTRVTDYVILQQSLYGCLQIYRRCNKLHGFSHKELLAGSVAYAHDGSENLHDEITLVAVSGQKRSIPLVLTINILPINDHKPMLVNNTGAVMWEGGVSVITSHMLGASDADRPSETLRYQILDCWWGNVSLLRDHRTSLQFFTQELIDKNLVVFRHQNGTEAKFTFNISDGLHSTKEYVFHIKTKPVTLNVINNVGLHIFPLQRKFLTPAHLIATISDPNREIVYEIIVPPSLGRLMKKSDVAGIFKVISHFSQDDVNNSKIFYEHTHPFADLYANDSFKFNVKSHLAVPLMNQKFKIDISVSSGGLDAYVNIPKVNVDEGGMTTIPLNFSAVVTFLENHAGLRLPIIHAWASNPLHGHVFLQHYTNLTTFTQQQLESGQVYYQHDHSDSLEDNVHFSLFLIPGYVMLCNVTVAITINPINDQPFKLVTPAPHLVVVQGENHTITKSELLTEDADTVPGDLRYDLISGPSEGRLVLLPDAIPINHFSQADINENRLVYVHDSSVLTDTFNLRVWDGKFRPDYTVFNVRALPVTMNISTGLPIYLQQGSNVVLLSDKQLTIETNADKRKVFYTVKHGPKHGVLYVKDNPATAFTQTELDTKNVMYMQTDMTTASDSFRVYVGMISGNTSIGEEVEVIMKVQPLMQLGNFTVVSGESSRITLHVLDATPLAKLTSSNPRYTILKPPKYGEIHKIIRSSGEKRNVLDTPVQSFTHEEIQSGLIYIVVEDAEVGWGGLQDRIEFLLAASIFQPAVAELKIKVRSALFNEIYSTLAGPSDPAGHEGGMQVASPNMTRDYFLIVSMVAGVVVLGVAVIIIIKCRTFDAEELNKEDRCLQPIPLPRPPDRLMASSPSLKQHTPDGCGSPIPAALPHCKVTPISRNDSDTHARYPYGVDEHQDDWSSCEVSDPACPTRNNVMLRRNQYWV